MTKPGGPYDFVYVHTDIPEGITIGEWRARRRGERLAIEAAQRDARRRRRARAIRRWFKTMHLPMRSPRLRSREANG